MVRRWSILSANYRSLGIFIGALLEAPEYYFWFEIVGFSTILGLLVYMQSVRSRTFFDTLETAKVVSL
jgi:hypothetical protein